MFAVRLILAIGALTTVLAAQQPRFDAATVRPNSLADCSGRWDFSVSHGAVTAKNAPLRRIISRAYNLTDDRVLGPAWLDSQCYDIQAKAPRRTPDEDLMPMLQTLLAERFHLVARRESDERPIFALLIDKGGPKLARYADGVPMPRPPVIAEGKILFMVRHMPDLCERLGRVAGRPVIDKTGLSGDYQIVLTYVPFSSSGEESPFDIFSAVRDQLGLRLEPQRAAIEMLRIESVDKAPTSN